MFYTAKRGSIVYMASALGVVNDTVQNAQSFFGVGSIEVGVGHNHDIEGLDVSSDRKLCATGQRGKNPVIFVWDLETLAVVDKIYQGANTVSAHIVRFSANDAHVFSIDQHAKHKLHIYDRKEGVKSCLVETGEETVFDMATSDGLHAAAIACFHGLKFVTFDGKFAKVERGEFGATKPQTQISVAFYEGGDVCVSGSVSGDVFLWRALRAFKQITSHQGPVQCVKVHDDVFLTSGQDDNQVKLWNRAYEVKAIYQLEAYARSLDYLPDTGQILAGTRDGKIIQLERSAQVQLSSVPAPHQPKLPPSAANPTAHLQQSPYQLLVQGHFHAAQTALDIDQQGIVLSGGQDNLLLAFNSVENRVVNSHRLQDLNSLQTISALAINRKKGHVLVGLSNGQLRVRQNWQSLDKELLALKLADAALHVLQTSPCQ